MKFRWHRGGLAESMATMVEVADKHALVREIELSWHEPVNESAIEIAPYGFDDRIGWETHIVTIGGKAVGFTNGALP